MVDFGSQFEEIQSIMAAGCEAAGHAAATVRKQKEVNTCSACLLIFIQSRTLAHVLSTFRVPPP